MRDSILGTFCVLFLIFKTIFQNKYFTDKETNVQKDYIIHSSLPSISVVELEFELRSI